MGPKHKAMLLCSLWSAGLKWARQGAAKTKEHDEDGSMSMFSL